MPNIAYVYQSTDTNAPGGLTTAAGLLVTALDALLVNGYSLGTVSSITRSGSTATITWSSSHGMTTGSTYNRILIAGADQAEYNGSFRLTVTSSTQATFTVSGTPVTPATGTITATKPGAGWTKPYSGTNLAAYKQGTGSNGFYMRVDDSAASVGYSRFLGYETMSDINTGTQPFPTSAQQTGGLYWNRSNTTTPRSWVCIATASWFIFTTQWDGTNWHGFSFGDFTSYSYNPDIYNTIIHGSTSGGGNPVAAAYVTGYGGSTGGLYIARTYAQTGGSISCGYTTHYQQRAMTLPTYPHPVTGKYHWAITEMVEASPTSLVRGAIDWRKYPLMSEASSTNKDTIEINGSIYMFLLVDGSQKMLYRIE